MVGLLCVIGILFALASWLLLLSSQTSCNFCEKGGTSVDQSNGDIT